MAEIKIISRPQAPTDTTSQEQPTVRIISRPAQPETPVTPEPSPQQRANPNTGFFRRLIDNYRSEMDAGANQFIQGSQAGAAAMKGGFNPIMTPGGGDMLMGGMRYAFSPLEALSQTVLGDPVQNIAQAVGLPPGVAEMLGTTANLGGQVFGAGPVASAIKNAPAMGREAVSLVRQGGEKAAPIVRGAINNIDDVIKNQIEQATRRRQAAEADKPPSREVLRTAGGGEFQAAKALGGDIKPEVLQERLGGLRERVGTQDVDLSAEKTYPQARDMIEYLERRAADVSSFSELMGLQREARNFVKRARKAAETTGDGSDYRAAQIAMRDLDEFVAGLKPEDVVQGDPEAANAALRQAKDLWARQAKMDAVEDIVKKARRLDDADYLQNEFRKLALDDFEFQRFSPAEQKLIDEIAKDRRLERAAELIPGVNKGKKLLATRGVNTTRLAKAEKLLDMIARGEAAQAAPQGPSVGQRINEMLRPGPPNSRNRP